METSGGAAMDAGLEGGIVKGGRFKYKVFPFTSFPTFQIKLFSQAG